MHEQSLVRSILRQVDSIRRDRNAEIVQSVVLTIGPLSGVDPDLLASAYDQLAIEPSVVHSELTIRQVPLLACCDACGRRQTIVDFDFRCTHCDHNVTITSGDQLELTSVSLIVNEPANQSLT